MINNLFLYGVIGSGKSTLIRAALLPYLAKTGGFFVQRIFIRGDYAAFRLCPVGTAADYILKKEAQTLAGLDNLFLFSDGNGSWKRNLNVFETAGIDTLKGLHTRNKKIFLLDELGGVELKCPAFMDAVRQIIDAGSFTLGVVKAAGNAKILESSLSGESVLDDNALFFEYLRSHPNTELLAIDEQNRAAAGSRVKLFIDEALK